MAVRYILSSVWVRLSIFSQLSIIQYMGLCVFSLPISLVIIERIYTLSCYHHQIESVNYYPLFRVRSWNNGMRCMSLYIFIGPSSKYLDIRVLLTPTIFVLLVCLLFSPHFPTLSIFANQSNTTNSTNGGTGLPRDPRWWTLRTKTVNAVDIASNKMVAPKYWAVETYGIL